MKAAWQFIGVFLLACSASAQLSEKTIRAQFGKPLAGEYTVSSEMQMTVSYGRTRQVCQIVVRPNRPTKAADRESVRKALQSAMEKVVPFEVRGRVTLPDLSVIQGCTGFVRTRYEKVDITQIIIGGCPSTEMQLKATAEFKDASCVENNNSEKFRK